MTNMLLEIRLYILEAYAIPPTLQRSRFDDGVALKVVLKDVSDQNIF